ncbi:GTPase [Cellulophaga omnivescoria]|uniref:GTPase n=1 Tax=Cellulophaga omnivescoria TaxID=1888890 RepID=UPI001FE8A343|nr:GTPase [Cellulophaga omnivescoria]WBU88200.1 GTPase [Cellulophaga omnivescoria]WKB80180.1 GTPase [Cellulophaga lytica]
MQISLDQLLKIVMIQEIIFVYNAKSGIGNAMLDSAHKIFSPSTYNCNLCNITFGVFTEDNVWKKFRSTNNLELQFLHKDEFKKKFVGNEFVNTTLPVIFKKEKGELTPLIAADELNDLKNSVELIATIKAKL